MDWKRPGRPMGVVCKELKVDLDEEDRPDIIAIGYRSNIFHDDEAATMVDNEQHMIKWMDNDEQDLWIDRFDVRALVEDARIFTRKKVVRALSDVEQEEEAMLDEYRYEGLPDEEHQAEGPAQGGGSAENSSHSARAVTPEEPSPAQGEGGAFSAVHFSFGGAGGDGDAARSSPVIVPGEDQKQVVVPPELRDLADRIGLRADAAVPKSRKQHQAIEKTARFVQKQGDKMEATLKVRHGGNPTFGFLLVDHPLQAYYQAVKAYLRGDAEAAASASLLPPEQTAQQASEEAGKEEGEKTEGDQGGAGRTDGKPKEGETVEGKGENGAAISSVGGVGGLAAGAVLGAGAPEVVVPPAITAPVPEKDRPVLEPEDEDMRATLEKLAEWVAKSGREFEAKVRERQRGDRRFDFLLPWNPYNAYYRKRLEEAEERRRNPPPPEPSPEAVAVEAGSGEADGAGGEEEKKEEEKKPEEPAEKKDDPHAVTTRVAITSFGGEDSEEGEEEEGEEVKEPDETKEEKKEGKSRWDITEEKVPELSEAEKKAAAEAEKRAARLLKAKELAAKMQDTKEDESKVEEKDKKGGRGSRSPSPSKERSKRRSRSPDKSRRKSRDRSRDRGSSSRHRDRSYDRDRKKRRSKSRSRSHDRDRKSSSSRHKSSKSHKSSSHKRKSSRHSRSRSRSRDRKKDSKRSRKDSPRRRSRSHSKDRKRNHKSRSRSRSRSKSRDRKRDKKEEGEAKHAEAPPKEEILVSDELRSKIRALLE